MKRMNMQFIVIISGVAKMILYINDKFTELNNSESCCELCLLYNFTKPDVVVKCQTLPLQAEYHQTCSPIIELSSKF